MSQTLDVIRASAIAAHKHRSALQSAGDYRENYRAAIAVLEQAQAATGDDRSLLLQVFAETMNAARFNVEYWLYSDIELEILNEFCITPQVFIDGLEVYYEYKRMLVRRALSRLVEDNER